MRKIYALITKQGTAAGETGLCEEHLKLQQHIASPEDCPQRQWVDVTGNDAISCMECGYPTIPAEDD